MKKLQNLRNKLINGRKENKGFTLVELIVVIVILAILVGVTIGGIYGYVNKSRTNTDINNASAIQSALAPITTMKSVTVVSDTKEITASTPFTGVAADWTALGLANSDNSSVKKIQEMFPDGIPALKTADAKYKITYTKDSTNHVTSVKVEVGTGTGAAFASLEAQE